VPEPVLDYPGVVPLVCQRVAAGMPQHVDVNREVKAGALANALDQSIGCIRRERTVPLGRKDIARVRKLPVKLAQRPDLVPPERVTRFLPVLM
jgi:hypothetical protein